VTPTLDIAVYFARQDNAHQARIAIFSDIDDSFIASSHEPTAMADAWEAYHTATLAHWPIILVTGVDFVNVQPRFIREIPAPAAVASSVGTEIWLRTTTGEYVRDDAYATMLSRRSFDRDFDRDAVYARIGNLRLQHPERRMVFADKGEPYKVSLHFFGTHATAQAVAQEYRAHFPHFKVIVCEEIHYNAILPATAKTRKFCLDVALAGKDDAIEYLVQKYRIIRGLKAGDSGNDSAMLVQRDSLTPVLVGGYKPELLDAFESLLAPQKDRGELHALTDDRMVYIESGDRRAASSILHAMKLVLQR
jgi:hydroxymethylpyrimidine pyrophosphatase-like HAD family hydrolase